MQRVFPVVLITLLVSTTPLSAQRYNISYTPNSEEGLLLQLIEQLDGPAKVTQMDAFLARYPKHPSVSWIYAFQQDYYTKSNEIDKALEAGAKLCQLNPDDLEAAVNNQKLAEKKGDAALVEKWKGAANSAAQKLIGTQKPFYISQDEWNKRLDYAGGLIADSDYRLFKKATEAERATDKIKLFDELISKNPNSIYAANALAPLMNAHRSVGNNDRALQLAEKLLAKDPDQDEALLMVGQIYLDRRANYGRVQAVANRLLALGRSETVPPGFSAETWQRRRGYYVGAAYMMLGTASVYQNQFAQADASLRNALPYIKGNVQAEGFTYFYLGWSNYYMEKYKEAAAFFRTCLALPGVFQTQARHQLDGMIRERRISQD